jgi:hypothetical protein
MTGWSVTRKAPSFRRTSDITPAVEEIDPGVRIRLIKYVIGLILSISVLFLFNGWQIGLKKPTVPRPGRWRIALSAGTQSRMKPGLM